MTVDQAARRSAATRDSSPMRVKLTVAWKCGSPATPVAGERQRASLGVSRQRRPRRHTESVPCEIFDTERAAGAAIVELLTDAHAGGEDRGAGERGLFGNA